MRKNRRKCLASAIHLSIWIFREGFTRRKGRFPYYITGSDSKFRASARRALMCWSRGKNLGPIEQIGPRQLRQLDSLTWVVHLSIDRRMCGRKAFISYPKFNSLDEPSDGKGRTSKSAGRPTNTIPAHNIRQKDHRAELVGDVRVSNAETLN